MSLSWVGFPVQIGATLEVIFSKCVSKCKMIAVPQSDFMQPKQVFSSRIKSFSDVVVVDVLNPLQQLQLLSLLLIKGNAGNVVDLLWDRESETSAQL